MMQLATKVEMNRRAGRLGKRRPDVIDVLDNALQKGPWLLGDNFSAADIMIGSGLNFAVCGCSR